MNIKIELKRLEAEYDQAWAEAEVAWVNYCDAAQQRDAARYAYWVKYYDAAQQRDAARYAYWAVKDAAVAAQNKARKARQKAKRKK